MRLQYEIDVVGQDRLKRVLRSSEQELRGHARTTAAIVRRETGGTGRGRPDQANRHYDQIGRAARAADLKMARDQISTARRVEMERVRSVRKIEAETARATHRAERVQIQAARRVEAANSRAGQRAAASRSRAAQRAGQGVASSLGNGIGNLVGMGGSALALAGGFSAASSITQGLNLEEMSRRIAIAGRQGGKAAAFTPEQIQSKITSVATASGIDPEKLAAGMQAAMDKTGDLAAAMSNLNTVAQVTQATGGDATDAYMLQADAMQKFGLNTDESAQAMATLIAQGKKGAFTFKNMAALAPKAFAAAASFGFKGQEGLGQIGGMLQVARNVTGSDEQAAFATEALLRQMTAKGKDMQSGKAFGGRKVNVFKGGDPRNGANNFRDILGEILTSSEGNLAQLQEVFGEEGIRGMRPFLATFRETREAGLKSGMGREGANKAGASAALKVLDDATNVTTSFADVQADAAEAMKSTSVQLTILNTKIKQAISSELIPVLIKIIPEFAKLVPEIGKAAKGVAQFAEFFLKNPLQGIGAIVAASMAKDLGVAILSGGVSRAVASSLSTVMGGARGPMPAGTGGAIPVGGTGVGTGAGPVAALAAGGALLALDQANKLKDELGVKGSLLDILPGMKGGSFSSDTFLTDLVNPFAKADRFAGVVGETAVAAHDLGKPVEERKALQKGVRSFSTPAQQQMGGIKVEGGKEMVDAAQQWKGLAGELRGALATGPTRDGRPIVN